MFKRMEPRRVIVRAVAGDGAGNVAVPGYTNIYWVRIVGKASFMAQAYCDSLIPAHGMNVLCEEKVEENRKRYVIIGRPDTQGWFDDEPGYGQGSLAPTHSVAHEQGGPDMLSVSKGMLENLRATPTDPNTMAVYVSYDLNVGFGADYLEYDGGNSPNFTAPAWGERYDLLTIDSTGTLAITTGTEAWTDPTYPSVPFGKIPICYVLTNSATTSINANMIYDCRPVFSVGGGVWTDAGA